MIAKKFPKTHKAMSTHIPTAHGLLVILLVSITGGRLLFSLVNTIPPSVYLDKASLPEAIARDSARIYANDRIIVKFKSSISQEKRQNVISSHGSKEKRDFAEIHTKLITVPQGKTPENFIAELKTTESASIDFAEVDALVSPSYITNDTYLTSEWHISKIGATTAWDTTQGSGVTVAVLDTGTDCTHPDLIANCISGWNVASNTPDTTDIYGHGTKTAGVVGSTGDNLFGTVGTAYKAKIMPVRITNDPTGYAYWSDITNGVLYAADHGAKVVTNSYASTDSSSVQSAASYLRTKGGIMVASAGNSGGVLTTTMPPQIITVTATDVSDIKTSWSSYGSSTDVSAPGANIYTTIKGGGYGAVSGTSFSGPMTAGVLALIFSANPSLTPDQAQNILFSSADDLGDVGWDIYYGWGRINAAKAVALAISSVGLRDTTSPTTPNNVSASALDANRISLSWSPSMDNIGTSGYVIYRNNIKIATVTTASYIDTGLTASTLYSYTVQALDSAGNMSPMSTAVSATTQAITLAITTSSVPSKTGTTAIVKWTTNLPATSVINYGKSATSLTLAQSLTTSSTSFQTNLTNLTAKTIYYYQITITGTDGKSVKGAIESFRTNVK